MTSIDFSKGYSSSFRLMVVDPATWADSGEVKGLSSASVERDRSTDLLESGSMTVAAAGVPEVEFYARLEMLAESGSARERHAIATLLLSPGTSTATVGMTEVELVGRSVLAPANDRVLMAGTYAPMGADGAAYAARLLQECIPAPVETEGGFKLSDHVVFARGTTYLEAVWMLLDTAGWAMTIDGQGKVTIRPYPSVPSLVLNRANARLIGPEVQIDDGGTEIPNRVIVADSENDDMVESVDMTDSPTSYKSIGRYVDLYEENPTLVDGESLQAYANRRLVEETTVKGKRTYAREWWPDVLPYSLVRGSMKDVKLDGDMRVLSQSLEIGFGVSMSETSEVIS